MQASQWQYVEKNGNHYAGVAGAGGYLYLWCVDSVLGLSFLNAAADAPADVAQTATANDVIPVQLALELAQGNRVVQTAVTAEGPFILAMKWDVVDELVSGISAASALKVWTAMSLDDAAKRKNQVAFTGKGSTKAINAVEAACQP